MEPYTSNRIRNYNTRSYFPETITETNTKNWAQIRTNIQKILQQEENNWKVNGVQIKEHDVDAAGNYIAQPLLEKYWKSIVSDYKTAALQSIEHNPDKYWSAAFVSWVMKEAGVDKSDGFMLSGLHMKYVVYALSNAIKKDFDKPFWLHEANAPLAVGDILCFNRNGSDYKLDALQKKFLDSNGNVIKTPEGSSHCDIVKEIVTINNKKYAVVVGGNKGIPGLQGKYKGKGLTVISNKHEIDSNNVLVNPKDCYAVIKIIDIPAPSSTINSSVGIYSVNNIDDVKTIQELLKNRGYTVPTDGRIASGFFTAYLDKTVYSIFNFQANNNLRVTGTILPNDATFNLLSQKSSGGGLTESDDESVHQPFITNAFTFRRNAGNANTLNVIFEGDSWLDYPIPRVLDLYDTISSRNQRLNLNCLHLAKFGETTTNMYNDRSRFQEYVTNYRIDRIYFSGGGNDVFPNLTRIVRPGTSFNQSFFSDPNKYLELRNTLVGDELNRKCIQYKNYLNTTAFDSSFFNSTNLNNIFSVIKNNYLRFGNIVNTTATPNLIFYMHTYDYPIYKLGVQPSLGVNLPIGPWVKPAFDSLGITDPVLINFIVIRLLDKFYGVLYQINNLFIANGFRFQTRIIDYRGLLNSSEYWRDEIHPNSTGASRLATRVNF